MNEVKWRQWNSLSNTDELINKSALLKLFRRNSITDKVTFSDGKSINETIETFPTVDAVEAIKSTEEIEQALSILNIYRNSYYAEPSNTVKYAVANAINTILPLFVKCLERRSE